MANILVSSRFNVMAYGAKGDGITDDAPAIQYTIDMAKAAVNGMVYAPAGTYLIGHSLEIDENIKSFAGDGIYATTFKQKDLSNLHHLLLLYNNSKQLSNVEFQQFTIDGNRVNQTAGDRTGLKVRNASDVLIDKIRVIEAGMTGLLFWHTEEFVARSKISNSIFKANSSRGLLVNNAVDMDVTGNKLYQAVGDLHEPFYFETVKDFICDGNSVYGVPGAWQAMYFIKCEDGIISCNRIRNSGDDSIGICGGDGINVNGNNIKGSHENGIALGGAPSNISIVGNTIKETLEYHGICVASSEGNISDVLVANNTIIGAVRNGIQVGHDTGCNVRKVKIGGNKVRDCEVGISIGQYEYGRDIDDLRVTENFLMDNRTAPIQAHYTGTNVVIENNTQWN